VGEQDLDQGIGQGLERRPALGFYDVDVVNVSPQGELGLHEQVFLDFLDPPGLLKIGHLGFHRASGANDCSVLVLKEFEKHV
jgi:hypothetical protein